MTAKIKPVMAWGMVSDGQLTAAVNWTRKLLLLEYPNMPHKIVRVRISVAPKAKRKVKK